MKRLPGRKALALWAAWWVGTTLAFWFLGRVVGQEPSLPGCAATAVLAILGGELGDGWRRRRARGRAARPAAGTGGPVG
ncbi:hypothetical protein ACF09K_08195 [Streptomyces sp. NPDC014882]|uniref:hypothetical protein n=1 Tax=Streptomyces sp. NPDC014882 TaxID=3364927 RepID=UPI0036FD7338